MRRTPCAVPQGAVSPSCTARGASALPAPFDGQGRVGRILTQSKLLLGPPLPPEGRVQSRDQDREEQCVTKQDRMGVTPCLLRMCRMTLEKLLHLIVVICETGD